MCGACRRGSSGSASPASSATRSRCRRATACPCGSACIAAGAQVRHHALRHRGDARAARREGLHHRRPGHRRHGDAARSRHGLDRRDSRSRISSASARSRAPTSRRADRKQLVGPAAGRPATSCSRRARRSSPSPAPAIPMTMLGHVTSSYRSPNLGRTFALAMVRDGRARHRPEAVRADARPHDRGDRDRAGVRRPGRRAAACLRPSRRPAAARAGARGRAASGSASAALGKIDLRGDPGDRAFMAAVGRALDLLLPSEPNTTAGQGRAHARSGSAPIHGC